MITLYFVILSILSWIIFISTIKRNSIKELFGGMIFASFLALFTDLIMIRYKLWSYKGLPEPLYTVPLLLDFSIYPTVTGLYLATLPERWPAILVKIAFWSSCALMLEWLTLKLGQMQHHLWWSLTYSALADVMIFGMITIIYRYYRTAYQKK